MVKKVIEVPQINLGSQKSPNIIIKLIRIRFDQTFEAMQHKGFYLTYPMKIKNNKKTSQGCTGRTVELEILL